MKPSKIKTVKAKTTKLLFPGFNAITWMGTIYCKKKEDASAINESDKINSQLKSHESIHIRQAQAMHDSWLVFYLRYVFDWICNLPLIFINVKAPYKFIATEIEAYLYQDDFKYSTNGPVYEWKKFEKIPLSRKRILAKTYYKNRKKYSFTIFIRKEIMGFIA